MFDIGVDLLKKIVSIKSINHPPSPIEITWKLGDSLNPGGWGEFFYMLFIDMFVQITEKWRDTGILLFWFFKEIYSLCKDEWYNTIWEVNINKSVNDTIFMNPDTWEEYSKEDQTKIRKRMIHNFVGTRDNFPIIFKTDNIEKILKKIEAGIKKLQKMENLPS